MTLDRETLAAQFVSAQIIAAPNWAVGNCNPGTPSEFIDSAFKIADKFLAYAASQRKQPEPAKVDHDCDKYACNHPSHAEPAPKREARPREWIIDVSSRDKDDHHYTAWDTDDADKNWRHNVRVREVLE